jgi:hypothetical protein
MNCAQGLMVGIMAIGLVGQPNSAHAKTFHCGSGDVTCLIAAINEANDNVHEKHTIRLPGTYTLTEVENLDDGANGLKGRPQRNDTCPSRACADGLGCHLSNPAAE